METINAVLYIQALLKLRHSLHDKRPMKTHINPQHSNAHTHSAHLTLDKIEKFGWEMLPYPSYTLDLAPSDCHVCGSIKVTLGASTTKTLQQSHKQCMHGCKIMKQTSTKATYSSLCSIGRNSWIILGISWNNRTTSPVAQDDVCFVCAPLMQYKVNVLMTFSMAYITFTICSSVSVYFTSDQVT
jgi:hypothetical protein